MKGQLKLVNTQHLCTCTQIMYLDDVNMQKDRQWKHLYHDLVSVNWHWLYFVSYQSVKALFITKQHNLFPYEKTLSFRVQDIIWETSDDGNIDQTCELVKWIFESH